MASTICGYSYWRATAAGICEPARMTKAKDPYRSEVGERLRITAADIGFPSAKEFSDHLGLERGTVDAWFNGRALPPVQAMIPFCDRWGLTLEWVYKGDPSGLPLSRNIRLVAAVQGHKVPKARNNHEVADEPPPPEVWRNQPASHEPPRKPVRRKPRANAS